ncbi:hypothetical protein H8356DRAFT_1282565 [Neocallimastix lanati (nom. inval.)]|nr:hypothetical protein H8356DRAFT_1282565 [Neocallimastix sp. JGI-2020a]
MNYSKNYIKHFTDKSKALIKVSKNDFLDEEIHKNIKTLETAINDKISEIKQCKNPEEHFEDLDHFTELLINYDDLVSYAISQDKININSHSNNDINPIDIDETSERCIKYSQTKKLTDGLNSIVDENPDKFNSVKDTEKFGSYTSSSGGVSKSLDNVESYDEYSYRTFNNFLTAISEFDDYVTLDSIENNKDGSIDISNIYKGVGNFSDMYYEMSAVVDYLNEKNYLNDEQKSQINEAMNKLNKHLEGRKLK